MADILDEFLKRFPHLADAATGVQNDAEELRRGNAVLSEFSDSVYKGKYGDEAWIASNAIRASVMIGSSPAGAMLACTSNLVAATVVMLAAKSRGEVDTRNALGMMEALRRIGPVLHAIADLADTLDKPN